MQQSSASEPLQHWRSKKWQFRAMKQAFSHGSVQIKQKYGLFSCHLRYNARPPCVWKYGFRKSYIPAWFTDWLQTFKVFSEI